MRPSYIEFRPYYPGGGRGASGGPYPPTRAVLYYTAALLLRPGVSIDGTRFSGTAGQGFSILGIFAVVLTFGATIMSYGLWQVRTGRRDRRMILLVVGLAALLWLVAKWI